MAFYIEWLQKPLTTMFPVTETQSSTRPQRLLNVLRRERILKADSRCFGEILQKNFKFACSQQLCEHLPLFIKSFIYHIIYLRESRRRKSKRCRRMRRPTADFENTARPSERMKLGPEVEPQTCRYWVRGCMGQRLCFSAPMWI